MKNLEKLLERIDSAPKWEQDWIPTFPTNLVTGHKYSGMNFFWLMCFGGGRFATFKQAQSAGYKIKKGAKGIPITVFSTYQKENEDGEIENKKYVKGATVFHEKYIEGIEKKAIFRSENIDVVINNYISKNNIKTEIGEPSFTPFLNRVKMPNPENFDTIDGYYSAYFHELIHSTALPLGRELSMEKKKYAHEELVAEFGAFYLCAKFNVKGNHESYLKIWKKYSPDTINEAAKQAIEAAEYILK